MVWGKVQQDSVRAREGEGGAETKTVGVELGVGEGWRDGGKDTVRPEVGGSEKF